MLICVIKFSHTHLWLAFFFQLFLEEKVCRNVDTDPIKNCITFSELLRANSFKCVMKDCDNSVSIVKWIKCISSVISKLVINVNKHRAWAGHRGTLKTQTWQNNNTLFFNLEVNIGYVLVDNIQWHNVLSHQNTTENNLRSVGLEDLSQMGNTVSENLHIWLLYFESKHYKKKLYTFLNDC